MEASSGGHVVGPGSWDGGVVSGRFSVLSQRSLCAACVVDTGAESARRHQFGALARYDRSFFANLPAVIQVAMVSFMAGAQ